LTKFIYEFSSDRRPQFLALMWMIYLIYALLTGWVLWTWAALFGGVLFFFVFEYMTHRFLLHGVGRFIFPRAYRGHLDHHDQPDELRHMLTPNSYNIPYHPFLWLVFGLVFQSFHMASAFMGGFITFQIYYEWSHYVAHRPITPRTAWGKYMKKHHLLHHYKASQAYYGVTNSALDRMLRTNEGPAGKSGHV
jgi:4-hydroxysphinganine ceramide fatty acyl 2-hydroxylase